MMSHYVMVEADSWLELLSALIYTCTNCLSTLTCCPLAYGSCLHSYTHPTWLRFWGTWLVESRWCHYLMVEADSHFKLLVTLIWDIYNSVWAHWYAVHCHWHNTTWLRSGGSAGSLVEWKWWHYVLVEAESHLKQWLASTLDINKV